MACIKYGQGKWGNEFPTDREPTVADFLKIFNRYANDIGQPYDTVPSHRSIPTHVSVHCQDENDDTSYRLVAIEGDYLGGCGCPSGITIIIDKEKEEKEINVK